MMIAVFVLFIFSKASQLLIGGLVVALFAPDVPVLKLGDGFSDLAFVALLIAPLVETVLIAAANHLSRYATKQRLLVAGITAATFTALHGLSWFSLAITPSFFAMSWTLEYYRERAQIWIGLFVITLAHMLLNLSSLLVARWTNIGL